MTTPTLPPEPNDELVAIQWIGTIPALIPLGGTQLVATRLPESVDPNTGKPAAWLQTGFITVSVAGGNPDPLLPVNKPVMQVDCYAAVPGSNKPPWGVANTLASAIRRACWDRTGMQRQLDITASGVAYPGAVVKGATLLTAFRRMYDDAADYARYQGDLWLWWTKIPDHLD